jgi:hypothetical protein
VVGAVVVAGLVVVAVVVVGFEVEVVVGVLLQATSIRLITKIKPNMINKVFFIRYS